MSVSTVLVLCSLATAPQQSAPTPVSPTATFLESIRRTVVQYDITFDSVLRKEPQGKKPELLRLYPDPAMWPQMIGMPSPPSDTVATVGADGSGYSTQAQGTVYFPDRCTLKLRPASYQTLLLEKGLDTKGNIVGNTYVTVASRGSLDGNVTFSSYGNLFVWGDVKGNVYSNSYFGAFVQGNVTGVLNVDSATTIYIAGTVPGTLRLGSEGSKAWIGGRITAQDMGHFEGRGHLFLADSDMTAGNHQFGELHVTVLPDGHREPLQ